jgi:hypothetical protein
MHLGFRIWHGRDRSLAGARLNGADRFPGAKQSKTASLAWALVPAYLLAFVRVDRREHGFKMALLRASRRKALGGEL